MNEAILRADYENVRQSFHGVNAGLKPYDALTAEEKARHAEAYARKMNFFDSLGQAITEGSDPRRALDTFEETGQ
ncbi:hypothetical protein [Hyphomicrobium sp.]|uniref:hypothetical protein n=1 Tax=Hyphomicrobium sp. TaxID=82 RepID=UPI001DE2A324|nr:hypothetical protein [Hyphomicrobium sp.]MBY0562451.1 hypothetical protein [Hyphomicrobium sp.]